MSSEGGAGDLFGLLHGLDTSTQQLRQSVDAERDARVHEHELLQQKITTAREAVDQARRSNRRSNAAFAVVIIILLGILVNRQIQDRNEKQKALHAAIVTCENGNRFRTETDERFNSFLDVLAGGAAPATTTEVAKTREALIATIKTNFAATRPPSWQPRDCSPEGIRAPKPLPTTTTAATG